MMDRPSLSRVVSSIVVYGLTSAFVGFLSYRISVGIGLGRRALTWLTLVALALYTLYFWVNETFWLSVDTRELRGSVHPPLPFPLAMALSLMIPVCGAMAIRELSRLHQVLVAQFGAEQARLIFVAAGIVLGVGMAVPSLAGFLEKRRKSR